MSLLRTALYVVFVAMLWQAAKRLFCKRLPQKGGGFAAPGWRKVADVFRQNLDQGLESGGIFTVFYRGELVVEFWGGYADEDARLPWNKDTLSIYCSVTKIAGAVVIQMLIDRGLLEMDSPVVKYWPEFGEHDKDKITVAQLLSHQAGVAIIEEKFSHYDILNNPEKVGRALASQKPNWPVGESFGYHGITMGLLMDQLVRRVDPKHRSLAVFFQDEVAEPFGIDFHIGLPLTENYRTARVKDVNLFSFESLMASSYWNLLYVYLFDGSSLFRRSLENPPETMDELINNPYWREVPSASMTGFGTGASMAKLMGILANDGMANGQQLLSHRGIQRLQQPLVNGTDIILLRNMAYGAGSVVKPAPLGGQMFGHHGAGGQISFADPQFHLGWSYLTNHHSIFALGDWPKVMELELAMYECAREVKQFREFS